MKKLSRVDVEIFLLKSCGYVPFIVFCLTLGYFTGRFIVSLTLVCIFSVLRTPFPKTFHIKNNDILCCLFSFSLFLVVIPKTIPLGISLFGSVISSLFIGWLSFLIQEFIDLKTFKKKYGVFDVETCDNKQVEELCRLLHYSNEKSNLAKLFFVEKYTNRQVYEYLKEHKLNVDEKTVRQYRYLMAKDFRKILERIDT